MQRIESGQPVSWTTGISGSKMGRVLCLLPAGESTWAAAAKASKTNELMAARWKGGNPPNYTRRIAGYAVLVERTGKRGSLAPEIYTPLADLLEKQNPQAKRINSEV